MLTENSIYTFTHAEKFQIHRVQKNLWLAYGTPNWFILDHIFSGFYMYVKGEARREQARTNTPSTTKVALGRGSTQLLNIRAHEQFLLWIHVTHHQMVMITRSSLLSHRCGNAREEELKTEGNGSWRRKTAASFQRKFSLLISPLLLKVWKGCLVLTRHNLLNPSIKISEKRLKPANAQIYM